METKKELLKYPQMARFLDIPIGTAYSWVSRKLIPHIRLSKRNVRFSLEELEKWIEDRKIKVNKTDKE